QLGRVRFPRSELADAANIALDVLEIRDVRPRLEARHISVRFRLRALPESETRQLTAIKLKREAAISTGISQQEQTANLRSAARLKQIDLFSIFVSRAEISRKLINVFRGTLIARRHRLKRTLEARSFLQEGGTHIDVIQQFKFRRTCSEILHLIADGDRSPV